MNAMAYQKHKDKMDWLYADTGRSVMRRISEGDWAPTNDPQWHDTAVYVINDKQVERRMAYADGKALQYRMGKMTSGEPAWHDFDGKFEDHLNFEFRLKPMYKVDTKLIVWLDDQVPVKRYFSHFDGDDCYCFFRGRTSWSTWSEDIAEYWPNHKECKDDN